MIRLLQFMPACVCALILVSLIPSRATAASLAIPAPTKIELTNGMTLLLLEQHETPIISFSFLVKTGSVGDPAGKEGVASLTAALLRKGTRARTAEEFSGELDFIGGLFAASAGLDSSTGSAEFLTKDIETGLKLLADALLHPVFPEEEVAKLQAQEIDGIRAAKDRAQGVISAYFNSFLFSGHPYGRPDGGTETSLATVTRDDIVNFYRAHYVPSNVILAVAGDFKTADLKARILEHFGAWRGESAPQIKIAEPKNVPGRRLLLVNKEDSTQTYFQIGNVGVARTNPDRVGIMVVNTLFGGRFTSMLNTELRIRTGLSYGARSSFVQRQMPGPFAISSFTKNADTEKAIDLTLATLDRLHEKGITENELASAKSYIKGQFPPRVETSDQLASLIAELEFYGLGMSEVNDLFTRIDAVTVADASRIIREHFPSENLVFTLIGKASEIAAGVKKYAPQMEQKAITAPGF